MEEEYKYKCDKCNYSTRYESHWNLHINTILHQTGKRKKRSDTKEEHKCDKCDYKSKNIINLKQHKLNEHGTKEERNKEFKYYCEYCDIGSFSIDIMERHKNTEKHKNIINILNKIQNK